MYSSQKEMRDFTSERFANNSARPGDYLASWNRKPRGQQNLLAPMTMDQDFLGKVTIADTFIVLSRSLKERWGGRHNNEQRKNPRQKWENRKMCWEARQRIAIQLSKSQFEVIVKDFVSRLVLAYRRGNLILNIMHGKFWFDGDFFVRNLDPSVELRQYQLLSQRNFFFSWQNGTFFLLWACFFSFSLYHGLSSPFDLHEQRFFHEQKFHVWIL